MQASDHRGLFFKYASGALIAAGLYLNLWTAGT
jgi:hypothetical protein